MGFFRRLRRPGLSGTVRRESAPRSEDVRRDVELILWSGGLGSIIRFRDQPYWEAESAWESRLPRLRLESVADHSWKVADAAMILVDRFRGLDRCRVLEMSLLHDKLELITGDLSPIDSDGTGRSTHAFNSFKAVEKQSLERSALREYVRRARSDVAKRQAPLFEDLIQGASPESRFVKAVDKLASLAFVIQCKTGEELPIEHVQFTLDYSSKAVQLFPGLQAHHDLFVQLFLDSIVTALSSRGDVSNGVEDRTLREVGQR